jgi:signal transduction histidine kinase
MNNLNGDIRTFEQLKRDYDRLVLMQEVSQYHATSVQDLLDFALGKVIALTESSIGYIYHYHEDTQEFVLNTWSKAVMEACRVAEPQSIYQLDKTGIWGEVVRQRRPIMVNEYAAPSDLKKGYPDGHVHLSRFMSIPVFENDRIVAVVGVANKVLPYDQTDIKQLTLMMEGVWRISSRLMLEEQVMSINELFSLFMKFSPIYCYIKEITDTESRVIQVSDNFVDMVGIPMADMIGKTMHQLFSQEFADKITTDDQLVYATKDVLRIEEQLNGASYITYKFPIERADGRALLAGYTINITDQKLAEESLRTMQVQLMQNDKLATIGQLAAGVAHEINNPMGFVSSNMITLGKYIEKYTRYIELLEQEVRTTSGETLPEHLLEVRKTMKLDYIFRDINVLLEESNEGIERVKRIVGDLRIFSHADTFEKASADLNSCIDSTINIVINEIKYAAELVRNYGLLPKITCNIQQISQVFMNLLINAAHAIQAKGDEVGEITICTWCDHEHVFVSIADNGCGIPPEHIDKIFDAFYTSKEVGKGTGLGLSISSEIIRKHGGEISVATEPGVGSTFTVRLPLHVAPRTEG